MSRSVYFFERGNADGDAKMKQVLGGKGANLAEMCRIGLPVPPGFTIGTAVCGSYYEAGGKVPDAVAKEVDEHLARLEKAMDRKFGSPEAPLFVSVRSGAAVSMPGM